MLCIYKNIINYIVTCIFLFVFRIGLIVNGFINVVITTIERRFGLRSRQTGLVASGYDIASFLCLVPVTYFGGRLGASKPRIIAWGVILLGLGSFTFALPHFLVGPYRATMSTTNTCSAISVNNDTSSQVHIYLKYKKIYIHVHLKI